MGDDCDCGTSKDWSGLILDLGIRTSRPSWLTGLDKERCQLCVSGIDFLASPLDSSDQAHQKPTDRIAFRERLHKTPPVEVRRLGLFLSLQAKRAFWGKSHRQASCSSGPAGNARQANMLRVWCLDQPHRYTHQYNLMSSECLILHLAA